jgi:hypothetical protein
VQLQERLLGEVLGLLPRPRETPQIPEQRRRIPVERFLKHVAQLELPRDRGFLWCELTH